MVKNSPTHARDVGLIPGLGRFHMPRGSQACVLQLLVCALELCHKGSHRKRSPPTATREWLLLTATRQGLCAAMKIQHSQKQINKTEHKKSNGIMGSPGRGGRVPKVRPRKETGDAGSAAAGTQPQFCRLRGCGYSCPDLAAPLLALKETVCASVLPVSGFKSNHSSWCKQARNEMELHGGSYLW